MGKERGSLERKFFPTSEAAPSLALLLETCKGCFKKWNWQILFSSTPQKSEGSILPIMSRFLNCILCLLRPNDCSTSTPLMLSWAWQKGQGCFFLQLSLFLWGRVLRMCWSVSKFVCLDWSCIFLFVFMLGSKLTASYISTWVKCRIEWLYSSLYSVFWFNIKKWKLWYSVFVK